MSRPQVSVVVPTYNRRHRIGPTLAGALNQEDVDVEVIVVDDCSPDDTTEYLRGLGIPNLRVLRNETNRRQAFARNRGIAEARGEWVAFLDDDDLWAPGKLREQLRAAGEQDDADIAFSAAVLIDESLRILDCYFPTPPDQEPAAILERYTVPAGCSNMIVRTEFLREIGGFDEQLDPSSDWDMFIRLMTARPAAVLYEPHVGYVQHPVTMSASNLERQFEDFDTIERKYGGLRRRYGVVADGVQHSRWLAGGLRRGGHRRDAMRAYWRGAVRYRNFGNVLRAAGVPFGERLMSIAQRPKDEIPCAEDAGWLDLYRPGGRLAALPLPDRSGQRA